MKSKFWSLFKLAFRKNKKNKVSNSVYITTTLPYVNASPHVGFALEITQVDALARFYRSLGREVFFNTGTDEHGQKIFEAAQKAGKDPQEYVDFYANEFKKLKDLLNLSPDTFIRTTDESHKKAAQELWRKAMEKSDIYKKKYKGLYCVGCEAFVRESDLNENGECPNHPGKPLREFEEENYFFALTKYKDKLKEYIKKPNSIIPEKRKKEALQILESLEDISISRDKSRLSWGVPVPGDESQVMYVWFDALTNYISTLGFPNKEGNFKKFWQEGYTIQLAGKDQVKFQSIIWQAMLLSTGIKNTDTVFYHGFITSEGQKMSKTLGNVISPVELVDRYGIDATRYILLRHVHPHEDTDLTWERMDEWYTANLVNGLGNLVARTMKMAETHLNSPVKVEGKEWGPSFMNSMESFKFNEALDMIWALIGELDQAITDTEPFKVVKTDKKTGQKIIIDLVHGLYEIAGYLKPFMPETAQAIEQAIKENKKPENLFSRLK